MNFLSRSPDQLQLMDGDQPFVQRGTLDWPLFARLLIEGEPVFGEILADRRSVGANTVALATMWSRYQMLHWAVWPDDVYWGALRTAARIAHEEGMRLQWIVFASTKPGLEWVGMPAGSHWPGIIGIDYQKAHWERLCVTMGDSANVSYILANQPGHPDQPTPTSAELKTFVVPQTGDFPKPLVARNNPHEDKNPILPPLDFSCYCSSRKFPKGVAELGYSMWNIVWGWQNQAEWPGTRQASILFEPARVSEDPSNSGYEWANPGRWRQMARSLCFEGTNGGNFYSDQNRYALPLTGITRNCAVEFLGNIPPA